MGSYDDLNLIYNLTTRFTIKCLQIFKGLLNTYTRYAQKSLCSREANSLFMLHLLLPLYYDFMLVRSYIVMIIHAIVFLFNRYPFLFMLFSLVRGLRKGEVLGLIEMEMLRV